MEEQRNVIPVVQEELVTGVRAVKTGSVRVRKQVERIGKVVEATAIRDALRVRRVPIGRVVESMPQTREEGDTIIVPVVEEELVVHKRLVLKEEIHIQKRRTRGKISKDVTLDREVAVIEHLDAEGNIVAAPAITRRQGLVR